MKRAALLLVAACTSPTISVTGIDGAQAVDFATVGDGLIITGHAIAWSDKLLAPRHCFPVGSARVAIDGQVVAVEEIAAGSSEFRHGAAGARNDWVLVRMDRALPNRSSRRIISMRRGDAAIVWPDSRHTIVSVLILESNGQPCDGVVALDLRAAAAGWSGRPVIVDEAVIGMVHARQGEALLVTLLPKTLHIQ